MNSPCLTSADLRSILQDSPAVPTPNEWVIHLDQCTECRERLARLAGPHPFPSETDSPSDGLSSHPSPALRGVMEHLIASGRDGSNPSPATTSLKDLQNLLEPTNDPQAQGRFAGFEILGLLGSGGMGIVLDGFDPTLRRPVAIKVLAPVLAATPEGRERFLREARAAAAVVHPNLVTIHAVGEFRGLPFIAMERVQGHSLSVHLPADHRLPPPRILAIARDIAAGLAAAHTAGIVHRDVKPANVLLESHTGRAKITDFGLARCGEEPGLTRTGFIAGTPDYLSPEHVAGQTVGPASDLFGLGCVLYALVSGHSPFQAPSPLASLRRVLDDDPEPLDTIASGFPPAFLKLVRRLLAKDPSDRPASATEVLALLEEPDAIERPHPRSTPVLLAVATVIGVVIVLAIARTFFPIPPRVTPAQPGGTLPIAQATTDDLPLRIVEPDGTWIESFRTLTQAIDALPDSGWLELNWDGIRDWPEVELPSKPLRIRASPQRKPVWRTTNALHHSFLVSAPLVLEGIEIQASALGPGASMPRPMRRPPPPGVPRGLALLRVRDTSLTLRSCILRLETPTPAAGRESSCVMLSRQAQATLQNCAIFAPLAKAIVWRDGREMNRLDPILTPASNPRPLMLSNCAVRARDGIWLESSTTPESRVHVIQSTVRCELLLALATPPTMTNLLVDCGTSVIQCREVLQDARPPGGPALTNLVRWRDQSNVYLVDLAFLSSRGPAPALRDLPDWVRFWNQDATGTLRGWQARWATPIPPPGRNSSPDPPQNLRFELRGFVDANNRLVPRPTWAGRGVDLRSLPAL